MQMLADLLRMLPLLRCHLGAELGRDAFGIAPGGRAAGDQPHEPEVFRTALNSPPKFAKPILGKVEGKPWNRTKRPASQIYSARDGAGLRPVPAARANAQPYMGGSA